MLWECYVSLLRVHPFAEAQQRMKQYLINGYKMTPVYPTFVEARDALIAAASAADKADGDRFWSAFARRGAGAGALAPPRYSTDHVGVRESYDLISVDRVSLQVTLTPGQACDTDDILDNGESGVLRLWVRNSGPDQTVATDLRVNVDTPALTVGAVRVPLLKSGQEVQLTLPVSLRGATSGQQVRITLSTHQAGSPPIDNVKGELSLRVNLDEAPNSSAIEDVEASHLPWTMDHVSRQPTSDWSAVRQSPGFNHVFFVEGELTSSDKRLITPRLQVSATQPFVLDFHHAWRMNTLTIMDDNGNVVINLNFDGGVIELSQDNGKTWTDVGGALYNGKIIDVEGLDHPLKGRAAFVDGSTDAPALRAARLDLGMAYAGKTVQLRFRLGTLDEFPGGYWLVDDLAFSGITNTPFTTLVPEDGVCTTAFPPVVSAGPDIQVDERTSVTLQGSAVDSSNAPTYAQWTQLSGPTVTLRGADTFFPSFVAPEVNQSTPLVFQLSGSNGSASTTDTVTVTVRNVNRPPTVNAGMAGLVDERADYTLMGSASDADGDTLTYSWAQVSGTPVALRDATTLRARFTAPEVLLDETIPFVLSVSDGQSTVRALVEVTVRNVNRAPTANAGRTGEVDERADYTFTGSASDPDGDTLSYSWTQTSGTPAALRHATSLQASFTAPEVRADETLSFELSVSDGHSTTRSTVDVRVRNVNRAPTANAGDAFSVNAEATAELSGARSTDADGDTLTYAWVQVAGPPVTLSGATTATATFTAPSAETPTQLIFQLVVKDASLSSPPAFVTVTVTPKTAPAPTNPAPAPSKCGCSGTSGAPSLFGLALLVLARRRRSPH